MYSLMLYFAHSDVILMRSCRIITAGSKLRETSNIDACCQISCLYEQCINELVSRNWKWCHVFEWGLWFELVCRVGYFVSWEVFIWNVLCLLSGVCVLKSVFRYMFCMVVCLVGCLWCVCLSCLFFCFAQRHSFFCGQMCKSLCLYL